MKCCQIHEFCRKCKEETSLEGKEVRNTIVITFAFQVVFTAFNALQNLHSSLHDEESLGNICLAIMSGTAIISSVLSPTIIGLIGAKTAIVAFFAAHSVYILANFYPSFATMAPAAVALGAFNGPAWTSQALYISASAFSFSKSSSASPYSILSRFNTFFFAVYATSQIVGNLVTSTVIRDGAGNGTGDMGVRYCGTDDCPASENATKIEDPETWVTDIILGFFMACVLLGLVLTVLLLSPLPRSEWIQKVSVRSTATSCFNVLVSTNMLLLVPFIFFTAAENAFLLSAFTKSYVACPLGIHMVGYVMAVYGATTPIFVLLLSRLARIAGRFILLTLSLTIHIILFITLFQWSPTADDEALIFIIPIFWGVSESILQAQANSLIAMLFPSQKEPAFANFHSWRSLGYAITFLNASYMCVSTKIIVCLGFAATGLVLYICVEFKTKVKEQLALKRPRPSIDSIPSEPELGRESAARASVSSNRTTVSSLQSAQDRRSFDHVELAEIIMEAQQGWRRDEEGFTLEVNKVMSMEHLANSKVTNWYRTIPVQGDFTNIVTPRQTLQRPGLPRSLSDGQLHYAAAKVDAALFTLRRGQRHTINTGPKSRSIATPLQKRRHVSDINPPTFHVIRDIVYEEDELETENETGIDPYDYNYSTKDISDNVFEQDEDQIGEEEVKEIMDYRNLIRRFSTNLTKESLGLRNSREDTSDGESFKDSSSVSDTQNAQYNENEDDDTESNGGITFTIGTTSPSSSGRYNKTFESQDRDDESIVENEIRNNNTGHIINGTILSGSINNNEGLEKVTDDVIKSNASTQNTANENASHTKDKKRKISTVLNPFKRSRKISTASTKSVSNVSTTDTNNNGGREDDVHSVSDADSDGFVNYEHDDNDNYLANEVIHTKKRRKRRKIPISEKEDVSCIY